MVSPKQINGCGLFKRTGRQQAGEVVRKQEVDSVVVDKHTPARGLMSTQKWK